MSIEKGEYIWLDGSFVPWDEAKTHVLDHAIHYGTGVFEGIRAYETSDGNSAIFRLKDHVKRLFASARMLEMKVPYKREEIEEAIMETLRRNKLKECYIRPLIWYGYGNLGLLPKNPVKVMVAAWSWGPYLGKKGQEEGVRAKISTWTRNSPNSFPSEAKICGGYVNSVLAILEAKSSGYDEAILLDQRGYVSEGPGENIFIVKNGKVFTPPPYASILPGITRDTVIHLLKDLKYEVHETDITRSMLYNADEVFFTGTAAEVTPIREIDDKPVGQGKPGPITKKLQEVFFDVVKGKNKKYEYWLTYVYR